MLDTNILIHDPYCLKKFEDNDVFIPGPVIEELDKFKSERSERGYSAREAFRQIISFREQGDVQQGVTLPGGGTLRVLYKIADLTGLPDGWERDKKDNLILMQVRALMQHLGETVTLVTNDYGMILKADILSIPVQEYRNDRVNPEHGLYSGRSIRYVDGRVIDRFYKEGSIPVPETDAFVDLTENEFVILRSGEQQSALCKYQDGMLKKLYNITENPNPYGLEPRNAAQKFMMEAFLSPCEEHPLTIVNGPAGTGKTLFAIGCGLEQVMEMHRYKRVLVCRANVTMDEELGYLPGTEREKIDPLLRGVYDNLGVLLGNKDDTADTMQSKIDFLFSHDYLYAESIAYMRGRSICDTYVVIDEVQNTSPTQITSLITRIGTGSKIVLIGDCKQIDSPRLDYNNNGLAYALNKMKGSKLCEICSFDESESTRSPLAKEATERMTRGKE